MDDDAIIEQLEQLAESFGIEIRYEPIRLDDDLTNVKGGLCRVNGEYVLIINSDATAKDKIRTLAKALRHFDLDKIYIRPAIRELLDKIP